MGANIIAFGSALVFLVQASSQTEGAASAQNCELNLLQLQAMKNRPQAQASAGNCTQADEAKMNEFGSGSHDGSFPEVLAKCGKKAFSWFRWHRHKMEKCIKDKVKISKLCTRCSAKRDIPATNIASRSAGKIGALSRAWAARMSTLLRPRRASASTCRSRRFAEEGRFPLRRLGIQCARQCRFGHRASYDGATKECVGIGCATAGR